MQFITEPHDLPKYLPIDSPVSCSTLQWPILLLLLISVYKSAKIAGTQKLLSPVPDSGQLTELPVRSALMLKGIFEISYKYIQFI